MLDLNLLVASSSAITAVGAVIFSAFTAWRSGKSEEERKAAEERISVSAAREAVLTLRGELNEAKSDNAKNRRVIDKQNERIDGQGRIIRRQDMRIELQHEEIAALRKWVAAVKQRLADKGINGIPDVPRATDIGDSEMWPEDV